MRVMKYPELVAEMVRHGDTEKDLGKLIGKSYSSVSVRLSGKKEWSISEIDKICDYYGKNYYELFKAESK